MGRLSCAVAPSRSISDSEPSTPSPLSSNRAVAVSGSSSSALISEIISALASPRKKIREQPLSRSM